MVSVGRDMCTLKRVLLHRIFSYKPQRMVWGSVLVAGFNDEATGTVLGLEEGVVPVLHLCVGVPLAKPR